MVISTTRWTLDTCANQNDSPHVNCIMEFDADDSTTPPTIQNFRRVFTCLVHANLPDTLTEDEKIEKIKAENRRGFGTLIQYILENSPTNALYDEITSPTDGTVSRVLKRNLTISWFWSGEPNNRILNLNLSGITLTANQINTVQTRIGSRFGAGNVVFTNNNDNL